MINQPLRDNIFPPDRRKAQYYLSSLILLFLLLASSAHAATKVTAEVDNPIPTVGSRITYTVTVSGSSSLPDLKPLTFDGFEIVMGPSSSTNIEMINGRISKSHSLTYILRAQSPGIFTIGPAVARKRNRTYRSNIINIEVLPAEAPPSTTSSANASIPVQKSLPEVFLTATADKERVYKQEMIVVTYKLYLQVNVTGYEFTKLPKARGFWKEEFSLPRSPPLKDITVRGQSYKVATLKKIALFPTRTGKLVLEPAIAEIQVELPRQRRRSRDIFDSFFSRSRREVRSVSTQPLTLTVLDLPLKGRPKNFRGDVGNFTIRVKHDKSKLSQHDALTTRVTIRGDGYLKSIDAPELDLPSGFDQFDPTVDESISMRGGKMKGRKNFTYLVIPRRSGTFDLSPVTFSFFDPIKRKYQTVRAGAIRLQVEAADGAVGEGDWVERSDVALLDSDIRFIKELTNPLVAATNPIYNRTWFFLLLSVSPLLFLIGLGTEQVIIQRMSDPAALLRRRAPEKMRKDLIAATKAMKHGEFGKAVEGAGRGLSDMVGAVTANPPAGFTTERLTEELSTAGADSELIEDIAGLIQESDRIKFSGGLLDETVTSELLDRFKSAGSRLEKLR